jgi:hypothetical protein
MTSRNQDLKNVFDTTGLLKAHKPIPADLHCIALLEVIERVRGEYIGQIKVLEHTYLAQLEQARVDARSLAIHEILRDVIEIDKTGRKLVKYAQLMERLRKNFHNEFREIEEEGF